MNSTPDPAVRRGNPHFLVGESPAGHARRRGWEAGTRLVADDGYCPKSLTITAVGKEAVLARFDRADYDQLVSLADWDWQELPGQPQDGDPWGDLNVAAVGTLAAARGVTAAQLKRAAEGVHRYEASRREAGGQVPLPLAARHVYTALGVLSALDLPPMERRHD